MIKYCLFSYFIFILPPLSLPLKHQWHWGTSPQVTCKTMDTSAAQARDFYLTILLLAYHQSSCNTESARGSGLCSQAAFLSVGSPRGTREVATEQRLRWSAKWSSLINWSHCNNQLPLAHVEIQATCFLHIRMFNLPVFELHTAFQQCKSRVQHEVTVPNCTAQFWCLTVIAEK